MILLRVTLPRKLQELRIFLAYVKQNYQHARMCYHYAVDGVTAPRLWQP